MVLLSEVEGPLQRFDSAQRDFQISQNPSASHRPSFITSQRGPAFVEPGLIPVFR